ncbi:DUF5681 domain-containing protein [Phreatobacter oligotrophus]|jgi:hypothetical protein|uniref:DUF5681 domain-containing protein n=1 Tax=Phreatobacter oligotrophus TaxID=1122261 RepID=A0A2T4YYZ7_9HYPH|nr:DUF5681 domain-containing protein [Phreatobacter oligotrophus]MBX9992979.1 hypothetical protein [Phreatobacter oligotrophus]PTM52206.1 hypothetical protein C8P69_1085 [Phreatobacter oligotrophus]
MSNHNKRNVPSKNAPLYRVGKGKPPLETQFKKGVSGNPSGKRKRPKAPWEAMEALLASQTCAVTVGNRQQQVPIAEALIMRVFNDAMKGNTAATKIVMDLWTAAANRSDQQRDDELSPADEEILKALGVQQAGSNMTTTLAGEIRVTFDPDGTMSLEADEIDEDLVSRLETEIAEAFAEGGDPVGIVEALISSMRRRNSSTDGIVAVSESVTSILQKGDGTIEIRTS